MEQNTTEETQANQERMVRRKKRSRKPQFSIAALLPRDRRDVRWYMDIRLWSPVLLLLLLIFWLIPSPFQKAAKEPEPIIIETQPVVETEPVVEPIIPEAEALARLADSVGAGRSKNVKIIIMWVAINRSEDRANGYGLPLMEEIARPNQWQGYDEVLPYSQESYELAKDVLRIQRDGELRPLDNGMLWFVLNDNGSITVRNQFTATGNQKWFEKTVK